MKKILLALSFCALSFTSCKKDKDGPKTDVTFQFSDFNWEVGAIGKTSSRTHDVGDSVGDTLKNYAKYFYYRAYNSSGVLVSQKTQTSDAPDFGVITDVLDPGTYTVVFTASNRPLGFSRYGLTSDHFYDMQNGYWDDTFFQKKTVTVGTEPITHSVKLERIVGALEVTLLDEIPQNASKIVITAEHEQGVYELNSGKRAATGTKTKEFILTAADKGQANRKFLMHILNITRGLRITITSYNSQNAVLNTKVIDNVSFYQNRKTMLRGNLSSASTFVVTVDPVWGTPGAPINF